MPIITEKPQFSEPNDLPFTYTIDNNISRNASEFLTVNFRSNQYLGQVHVKILARCVVFHRHPDVGLTNSERIEQLKQSPKHHCCFLENLESILDWSKLEGKEGDIFVEQLIEGKGKDEELNIKDLEIDE